MSWGWFFVVGRRLVIYIVFLLVVAIIAICRAINEIDRR